MEDGTATPQDARRARVRTADDVPAAPGGGAMLIGKDNVVAGTDVTDTQVAFDHRIGEPVVTFSLTGAGTRRFARATTDNLNRRMAMVFDGEVISAPVIREPITGRMGQISGNLTVERATTMAVLLRAGAPPVRYRLVAVREVRPVSAGR